MNKRQRKKRIKKAKGRFRKLVIEVGKLFVPGKIDPRMFLFSTWDEQPVGLPPLRMPNLYGPIVSPEKLEALKELHKRAIE